MRAATCLLVIAAVSCGCSPAVKSQGQHGVTASYSGRTLSARLPAEAGVPVVAAAMDKVLRDRGYLVASSSVTADTATIVAKAPRVDNYPRVTLTARTGADATVVTIMNEPFGDQEQCRSLLDAVLRELGL
jgi:hypothetical protein